MKILMATDGSESADRAAEFLSRFNFSPEDEIIILHVIRDIPYADDYHIQIREIMERMTPRILDSTAEILQPLKAKISTDTDTGYPDTNIINKAIDSDIDLIVMGAGGAKGFQKYFIGSTSRSVAIKAPVSVLVVKDPQPGKTGPMKILFATDGSQPADAAGEFLASMPFPEDAELTILNVAQSAVSDIPETLVMEINDRMKSEAARVRAETMQEAEKIVESARLSLNSRFSTINVMAQFGEPAVELLNAERSLGVDIITMGCRGLRGIRGIMGSVSRRILSHSDGSVLIGKSCG